MYEDEGRLRTFGNPSRHVGPVTCYAVHVSWVPSTMQKVRPVDKVAVWPARRQAPDWGHPFSTDGLPIGW